VSYRLARIENLAHRGHPSDCGQPRGCRVSVGDMPRDLRFTASVPASMSRRPSSHQWPRRPAAAGGLARYGPVPSLGPHPATSPMTRMAGSLAQLDLTRGLPLVPVSGFSALVTRSSWRS
jgi:hypothetical protein